MLALNNLLSLLGHSVQLHILSTFFEVSDLQFESFVLVLHLFKQSLVLQDVDHLLHLRLALALDLVVLASDRASKDQDRVFVVCCNWRLRNFDLALLQIYYHLEVVLQLLNPYQSLAFFLRHDLQLL